MVPIASLGDVAVAVAAVAAVVLLVVLLDRLLVHRARRRLAAVVSNGELSRATATRLRFLRRAGEAAIIVVAIAIALSQFDVAADVGRALLASTAITAAVVGFAARQTLANVVAGILLAITQPVRIGDLVTLEGETGTVEDVGLTYTWLRTGADARIIVPNERLAAGILRNDSIRSPVVATEVSVWLGRDADETVALAAIEALGVRTRIAEVTNDGIRLIVMGAPGAPSERLDREGALRASALRALREAGVRGPTAGSDDPAVPGGAEASG